MTRHKIKQRAVVASEGAERSAVRYARVSSKEQELGYSIAAQEELLQPYGARLRLSIEQEFVDVETAKTTGRPGFDAMVAYLRRHPACRVVLVEKTDRLYRNFKDYVTIDELGVEVHFVKENFILSEASRSHEKFMHGIKVLMAKNYIDNLSEEVQKGLHTKASQGLYPSFAPLGYVNTTAADGKRIIVPDPVLGIVVTKLFQWFASGEYSVKSLAQKAFEEGLRFRKSQSKIPLASIHRILRKRIYTGEFDYAGKLYQGSHEPLVGQVVWEQCQEILDGRHKDKHRKVKHDFAFSGVIRCGHCGCSLVGELKKGRYVYYHCTGYRGKCPERYTREEVLTHSFAERLRELVIAPEIITWLEADLIAGDRSEQSAREQSVLRLQAELERLQRRLEILYDDRLDGRIDGSKYDEKAREIAADQHRIRTKMRESQGAVVPAQQAVNLMALLSKGADLFASQSAGEKQKLIRVVLGEAIWKGGELRMLFRSPFEELRLSNRATITNKNPLEEPGAVFDIWR